MGHPVLNINSEQEILENIFNFFRVQIVLNKSFFSNFNQFLLIFQLHFSFEQILFNSLKRFLLRAL